MGTLACEVPTGELQQASVVAGRGEGMDPGSGLGVSRWQVAWVGHWEVCGRGDGRSGLLEGMKPQERRG